MGLHVHQKALWVWAERMPAPHSSHLQVTSQRKSLRAEKNKCWIEILKSSNKHWSTIKKRKRRMLQAQTFREVAAFCCKRSQGSTLSATCFRHIFLWGPPPPNSLFWGMLAGWACFSGQSGPLPWPDLWDVWSWAAWEKGSAMLSPRVLAGPPSGFGLRSGDRGFAWAPEHKKSQRYLVLLWGWREERRLDLSWLLPS